MKVLILDTICKHDQDRFGVDMSGKRKINVEKAADDLLQHMCYREVVAFSSSHNGGLWYFDLTTYLELQGYSEDMILKAIEQYKSEHI